MGRKGVRSQPSDSSGKRVEKRRWAMCTRKRNMRERDRERDLGETKKRKCLK